jgi:heme exporter protein CcmD
MSEFFDMKGYGLYIWPAYVIALGALWLNIWAARRLQRVAREDARRRLAMHEEGA